MSLLAGFVFVVGALALAKPAAAQELEPLADMAPPNGGEVAACVRLGLNSAPWQQGSAIAEPGRWWNPYRWGTGWDLVFNEDRTKLKAFFLTFDASGRPIWLMTAMIGINFDTDLWTASLYQYRKNGSTIESRRAGDVIFRFFRDDPSRIAMKWRWDQGPGGIAAERSECIIDINRLGPATYVGPGGNALESGNLVGQGVSASYSSYWNSSGNDGATVNDVPGVVTRVVQNVGGVETGEFGEFAVLLDFDKVTGDPFWVQSLRLSTPVPPFDNAGSPHDVYYTNPRKTSYPEGTPIRDCPGVNGTPGPNDCVIHQRVGTFTRNFSNAVGNPGSLSVKFDFDAGTGGIPVPQNRFDNTIPAQTLQTSTATTRTYKRVGGRIRDITVSQYVCEAPATTGSCYVFVSWAGGGRAYRRDLRNLTYSLISADLDNGVYRDDLNTGDRVQYELWQGAPGTPGALLLARAPEVRAVGPRPTNGENPIVVPNAPIVSNAGDLPVHDPTVGATAGEAGADGGAATYRVPIELPPGRAGMQPAVSLSYSSRGGNGIAGLGWTLAAGSNIHRCARTYEQDGAARGVALDAQDRLCLDGERLVYRQGGSGYGTAGAIYSTEIDSYARITQLGAGLGTSGVCFRVEHKDGRIADYGCAPSNQVCTVRSNNLPVLKPANATVELSWLVARVQDRSNNFMDYCYVEAAANAGEVLLDAITYTGSPVLPATRRVQFSYENRPTTGRSNDRSSSWLAGGLSQQTRRLKRIETYAPNDNGVQRRVRSYELGYLDPATGQDSSYYSGRSLLRELRECGYSYADDDVDDAITSDSTACLPATTFEWNSGFWDFSGKRMPDVSGIPAPQTVEQPVQYGEAFEPDPTAAVLPGGRATRSIAPVGDLDGDGSREVVLTQKQADGQSHTWLIKYTADRVVKGALDLGNFPIGPLNTVDVDGDGLAEIINGGFIYKWKKARGAPLCDNGTTVCSAAPDQFFRPVALTALPAGTVIDRLADINGDGLPDLVLRGMTANCTQIGDRYDRTTTPLCVWLNSRQGLIGAGTSSYAFVDNGTITRLRRGAGSDYEDIAHVSDFDGDGAADLIVNKSGRLQRVVFSRPNPIGVSFVEADALTIGIEDSFAETRWMDINGDGLDDAVMAVLPACGDADCFGTWRLQINKGGRLAAATTASGGQPGLRVTKGKFRYTGKMQQTDVDADGRTDLLYPAKFAARMCTRNYVANTVSGIAQGECPDTAFPGMCLVYLCPEPPPEDGNTWQTLPPIDKGFLVNTYKVGFGAFDPSVYRMNAIRFVQTGENAFRVQVDETPVLSSTSSLQPNASSDDLYGDGLADFLGDIACTERATAGFPESECVLASGLNYGPTLPLPGGIALSELTSQTTQILYLNENNGDGARGGGMLAPETPDLMVQAVNGLGERAQWDYFPLSSSAGRSSGQMPFYALADGYADNRHFFFQSSMPAVSALYRSAGVVAGNSAFETFGSRSLLFAYEGAMYNSAGRGFQGFRTISQENLGPATRNLRTVTTFHQKFPLTGRVQRSDTGVPLSATSFSVLSSQQQVWRCNIANRTQDCPGLDGQIPPRDSVFTPYLDSTVERRYDLVTAETGSTRQLATVRTINAPETGNQSGWDAYGNLLVQRVLRSNGDGVNPAVDFFVKMQTTTTTNTYASDVTNWWLDKLTAGEVTRSIVYYDRSDAAGNPAVTPPTIDLSIKSVRTTLLWNPDRTLQRKTVTDLGAGATELVTDYLYPAANYGLPSASIVTGTGLTPRETRIAYSADGYFPQTTTQVVVAGDVQRDHVATALTRARDGKVRRSVDPNGLIDLVQYDAFGQSTVQRYLKNDGYSSREPTAFSALQPCNPCAAADETTARFQLISVRDGAPSERTWFDRLGRPVKKAARGFDGSWIVTTKTYDAAGTLLRESAPGVSAAGPLTSYDYDRLGRMVRKDLPRSDLDANQGDLRTTYAYVGNRTDITLRPQGSAPCSAANLCISMSRYHSTLGALMRTVDALSGRTDYWVDAAGNVAGLRDAKGSLTTARYNGLGHRTETNDPNQGRWQFVPNALGEIDVQTDARGVVTRVTGRDALGRVLAQTRIPASYAAEVADEQVRDTWAFDPPGAKGKLQQMARYRSAAFNLPPDNVAD
ncbi:SpvB/TcaC N-terminal domain-containing protein [Tahibacter sp. UC22_41]|uniref:SpvB/TcaC N-terminal domain-containing protein n=1 Tax=Tahibacter sp. UC22_41 TaxID=3350178 RepID=UPI0036D98EE3